MTASTLDNDGFWPDIHVGAVATILRVSGTVPVRHLEQVVLDAMLTLNRELRPLRQRFRAQGYDTAAEVPFGREEWLPLYRRALYGAVGALLGVNPVGEHHAAYQNALRALLDPSRC